MRPAVILLLVCVLFMATVEGRRRHHHHLHHLLHRHHHHHHHHRWHFPRFWGLRWKCQRLSCGQGWMRLSGRYCVKVIRSPQTFYNAQRICRSLNANLLSIHSHFQMKRMKLVAKCARTHYANVWTGARRTCGRLHYTDGSRFNFASWSRGRPNYRGGKNCVSMNLRWWYRSFATARCSRRMFFVCGKKK
uniref:lithostathine-2-like isoform X2 n=1 Tax=Scatophagus argus TaxID=75038 RepID=UPI001ED7F91A|nr:lithostathine-2-like isoform X2 [Scatophagus argus]